MTGTEQEQLRSAARMALARVGEWLSSQRDESLVRAGRDLVSAVVVSGVADSRTSLEALSELQPVRSGSKLAPAEALTADPEQLRAVARQLSGGAPGAEQEWLAVLPAAIALASRSGDVELLCALTRALLALAAGGGSTTQPIVGHVLRRLLVSQRAAGDFPADLQSATEEGSLRATTSCSWLLAAYARPELVAAIAPSPAGTGD